MWMGKPRSSGACGAEQARQRPTTDHRALHFQSEAHACPRATWRRRRPGQAGVRGGSPCRRAARRTARRPARTQSPTGPASARRGFVVAVVSRSHSPLVALGRPRQVSSQSRAAEAEGAGWCTGHQRHTVRGNATPDKVLLRTQWSQVCNGAASPARKQQCSRAHLHGDGARVVEQAQLDPLDEPPHAQLVVQHLVPAPGHVRRDVDVAFSCSGLGDRARRQSGKTACGRRDPRRSGSQDRQRNVPSLPCPGASAPLRCAPSGDEHVRREAGQGGSEWPTHGGRSRVTGNLMRPSCPPSYRMCDRPPALTPRRSPHGGRRFLMRHCPAGRVLAASRRTESRRPSRTQGLHSRAFLPFMPRPA